MSPKAIDRSQVIWELQPGVANSIEALVEEAGGWHCEIHPDLPWPHDDDCPGPGMLKETE